MKSPAKESIARLFHLFGDFGKHFYHVDVLHDFLLLTPRFARCAPFTSLGS